MAREKHGMSKTKIYKVWAEMLNRCTNPNHANAKYYYDKGITVCDEWKSFLTFYNDMGDKPEGMWLERIDNAKAYCKENCKWETPSRQCSNRGRSSNTSGRMCVYWASDRGKWRAEIVVDGRRKGLGGFDSYESAVEAVEEAETAQLGFSRAEGFV